MRILEESRSERSRATAVTGLQAARAATSKQEVRGTGLPATYPLAWAAVLRGVAGLVRRWSGRGAAMHWRSGTPRGDLSCDECNAYSTLATLRTKFHDFK